MEYDAIVFDFVTNNNGYGSVQCGSSSISTARFIEHLTLSLTSGSENVDSNSYLTLKYVEP